MFNLIHCIDSLFDFGRSTQALWALVLHICKMKAVEQMIPKILTTFGMADWDTFCCFQWPSFIIPL